MIGEENLGSSQNNELCASTLSFGSVPTPSEVHGGAAGYIDQYTALPYMSSMHAVLTTPTFEADAADAGLGEEEIHAISAWLSENPLAGAVMAGTGGARKVRFAGKGKGKSGGYRTIHYYGGDDVPLFLLALIDKGDRENLSKAERNALAVELSCLADDYRAGVAARLSTLKRRI